MTGGSGSANPTNVLIPGAFKDTDPGYIANVSCLSSTYSIVDQR